MANWLDKYKDGGQAGYTDIPFKYNSAWGGQFQDGGEKSSRLEELGSDAYTAMAPFYNTLFEAANKYADKETGLVSPFNSFRAATKAMIKHPEVLFMKRHHLPNKTENPYGVEPYVMDKAFGPDKTWWPTDWAEPRKEHHGIGEKIGEWLQERRDRREQRRDERFQRKSQTPKGMLNMMRCFGANCYENETPTAAMGASIPGSVGFTYARTHSPAPSEGPYAKKTLPSAQKGKQVSSKEEKYEPSQMVNNAKAILAGIDLSTAYSNNPFAAGVNILARIANSTGDAYTAARYAMDGQWKNAGVDAGEAILDLIPFRKGKRVFNLSKTNNLPGTYNKLSKLDKSINRGLKVGKAAASTDDFMHSTLGKFLFGDPDSQMIQNKNGGMTYYQHGLDWKPKTISEKGSMIPQAQTGDELRQWAKENKIPYGTATSEPKRDRNKEIAKAVQSAVKKGQVTDVQAGTKATTKKLIEKSKENYKKDEEDFKRLAAQNKKEKEERIAERKAAKNFNEGKSKTFTFPTGETKSLDQMDWRDKAYIAGKSLEGKGRFFEDEESLIDDFNPFNIVGSLAGGLGTAPYEAKQSDSNLPYLTAIGAPVVAGMLGFDPLGSAIKAPGKIAQSMKSGLLSKLKGVSKPVSESASVESVIPNSSKVFSKNNLSNDLITYDGELVTLPSSEKTITSKDFFTNSEIEEMIRRSKEGSKKIDELYEEFGKVDPNKAPVELFDVRPDLKEQWDKVMEFNKKTGSFQDKFLTPEQDAYIRKTLGAYNHDIDIRQLLSRPELRRFAEGTPPNSATNSIGLDLNEILKMSSSDVEKYDAIPAIPNIYPFNSQETLKNLSTKFEKGKLNRDGGVIKDNRGQWAHPGEITEIGSNRITMQGVPYPVLGISDQGDTQMMFPEQEYKFKGKKVTEIPMAQEGKELPPIYTDDPRKVKSYTDSLNLYKQALKNIGSGWFGKPEDVYNSIVEESENYKKYLKSLPLKERKKAEKETSVEKNYPNLFKSRTKKGIAPAYWRGLMGVSDTDPSTWTSAMSIYKKPVQPYILKEKPKVDRKELSRPAEKISKDLPTPSLPELNLSEKQPLQGEYEVSYFDPTQEGGVQGGWQTKPFMTSELADRFMEERIKAGMYGPSMERRKITQKKTGGWLDQYQDGGEKTLEENYQSAKDWLAKWYEGRKAIPEFTEAAEKRIKHLNKIDYKKIPYADIQKKGASAVYDPSSGKIFVPNPEDPESIKNPKDIAVSYGVPVLTHEMTHALDYRNREPLISQKLEESEFINPEEYDNKSLHNWFKNSKLTVSKDKKIFLEPNAVLNMLRQAENMDPSKVYTAEDFKPLIEKYSNFKEQTPAGEPMTPDEHRSWLIRESFKMLKNNPQKLADLHNSVVSLDNKDMSIGKKGISLKITQKVNQKSTGGWFNKYK